ncbi:hypothetical protein [Bradyrhizobium sp.]|uniref:hypothetical protein n=1 Tax=Bradyrhizobium sp. TaxID=376 RepID=UPI001D7AE149|nr:hypothetical protein [Bradyrhizobium sp.]MBV8699417.1 hypothetical protein [Bradyrhizobium sp.]MBV8920963.1 hypothetical protein [Bradyrhizobium sp.]
MILSPEPGSEDDGGFRSDILGERMPLDQAKMLLTVAIVTLPWPARAQTHSTSRVEAAPTGQPYDYIVHVPNTYDYRYNPQVRDDRLSSARRMVRQFCPKTRVVGDNVFQTEIFGLITGKPDYVVYIQCR